MYCEFNESFQKNSHKILKLSTTRWLSHHSAIERILESWDSVKNFLLDMALNEKSETGKNLLSIMQKHELKAYLLFLKYTLNFFNSFNAYFQAVETKIHLLQPKSLSFLFTICKQFLKPELLKNICNIQFSEKDNQISLNEIKLGSECEEYLKELMTIGHVDIISNVRENCLLFYVTAAEEIRKRLPINDIFLSKLKIFQENVALSDINRETTFNDISYIAQTLGGFDENGLKKEWFMLHVDFTTEEKQNLAKLNFDDMWKHILQKKNSNNISKYPNLKSLLNAIRALPNSNADAERAFSLLSDLKTKKRNALSAISVNALCVVKSALKTRKETILNMKINEKHLSLMSSDNLYTHCPKKQKHNLNLYAADDNNTADPSTSHNM